MISAGVNHISNIAQKGAKNAPSAVKLNEEYLRSSESSPEADSDQSPPGEPTTNSAMDRHSLFATVFAAWFAVERDPLKDIMSSMMGSGGARLASATPKPAETRNIRGSHENRLSQSI